MKSIRSLIVFILSLCTLVNLQGITPNRSLTHILGTHLAAESIDELVLRGIEHISTHGEQFNAQAGSGLQAFNVTYTLLDSRNRLHLLRQPKSLQYFARELLAYFKGSLDVREGLSQASSFWDGLADSNGQISSNYGHYVFHQRVPTSNSNMTQFEWVLSNLGKNLDSRKAFININQPQHKVLTSKDFPCTIGLQFFVRDNTLCQVVSSRSTDIFTGLPYDMGFFSFLTELVYAGLRQKLKEKTAGLRLGPTTMKTTFTQIYDRTKKEALAIFKNSMESSPKKFTTPTQVSMPEIDNAEKVLSDIYQGTQETPVLQWIHQTAQQPTEK